jgi:hypothetical protein
MRFALFLLSLSLVGCTQCSDGPTPLPVYAEVDIDDVDEWPGPPPRLDPAGGATAEQLARRTRSEVRLRAEGVPVNATLPVIESEAECHVRTRDEIVDRLVALFAVASRGANDPDEVVDSIVTDYGAAAHYSPLERAFMLNPLPVAAESSAMSWRFESVAVLLWALGYRDALGSPTAPTDGPVIAQLIRSHTLAQLREEARPRTPSEILDEADLLYRYHWAVVDAAIAGRYPPAGLSGDVIMEWHQALNWLIGYQGAAWDDVQTDT